MKILASCLYILAFLVIFFHAPVHTQALTTNQAAAIHYARLHGFLTPATTRLASVKNQSWVVNIWKTIQPALLGSLGVIAGSAIAWYTLRKKKKTFSSYYDQIKQAQTRYAADIRAGTDKILAKKQFKKELDLIQEEAELNAAEKKLDQEQLTAIINKVKRMIDEVDS